MWKSITSSNWQHFYSVGKQCQTMSNNVLLAKDHLQNIQNNDNKIYNGWISVNNIMWWIECYVRVAQHLQKSKIIIKIRKILWKVLCSKAKHFTKESAQKYKEKSGHLVLCILQCKIDRNDWYKIPRSIRLLDTVLLIPILA